MGLQMDPVIVLGISIAITLRSCFTLQVKSIKTEKHYGPFLSSLSFLLCGLFSSLRRILSIVCWFIPSLGLFSVLYHYKAEQIPFFIWNRYNRTQNDRMYCMVWRRQSSGENLTDGTTPLILVVMAFPLIILSTLDYPWSGLSSYSSSSQWLNSS